MQTRVYVYMWLCLIHIKYFYIYKKNHIRIGQILFVSLQSCRYHGSNSLMVPTDIYISILKCNLIQFTEGHMSDMTWLVSSSWFSIVFKRYTRALSHINYGWQVLSLAKWKNQSSKINFLKKKTKITSHFTIKKLSQKKKLTIKKILQFNVKLNVINDI